MMSWTCPKCERELPWKDFRHYCKQVSLDSLFEGRSEELILVFDKILAEVADWPKVVIRPMKKWLDLKFYSKVPHKEKPVIKSVSAGKKYENHIRLTSLTNLNREYLSTCANLTKEFNFVEL